MYNIETFMDFTWPFSYIGFYILDRVRQEEELTHTWYPYLLNPDTPLEGIKVEQTFSEEQTKKALERLEYLGSDYNLEFNSGSNIYSSTRAHKATLFARDNNMFYEFAKKVFDSVFKEGKNIGKKEVLNDLALSLNLDVKDMNKAIDSGMYDKYLKEADQIAKDYNVKNVPTFIVDGVKKDINVKQYEEFKKELINWSALFSISI